MGKKVIHVPMEDTLCRALDDLSKKKNRSRAEVIREACLLYLRRLEEERLDAEYQEGYRRIPENTALGQAQEAMAAAVLEPEEW